MGISNCRVMVNDQSNQIVFCDDFRCRKFVGKTAYRAPRVYAKQRAFDARAADCWSLGVVLFMMIIGGSPYQRPDKHDSTFPYIINEEIPLLLEQWNRSQFVTP